MDYYQYEPIDLEGPTFRLLQLIGGNGPDIECNLFQAWLHSDSLISYEALSYTWGSTEKRLFMKVNGRTLPVTNNLYIALQHLRLPDTDRILWVDAICIDQCNRKERGHQVHQMGNIYSQADRVIFWLGQPTDSICVLMDSLKRLEQESVRLACGNWTSTDERWLSLWFSLQPDLRKQYWNLECSQRGGLDILLKRPWFKRVWILQEVAKARRALVCSGDKFVSARIFALAPFLLGAKPEAHCQAVLDIMPGPSRKNSWWSEKQDLFNLLLRFKESEASDPRDKIYALLGISSDRGGGLSPDYSKTIQEVVKDTLQSLFRVKEKQLYHKNMQEFFDDFSFLNQMSLEQNASSDSVEDMAKFFKQRGDDIKITENILHRAVQNKQHGKQIMEMLLEKRREDVKITRWMLTDAYSNGTSGKQILGLLLRKQADVRSLTKYLVAQITIDFPAWHVLFKCEGDNVSFTGEVVDPPATDDENKEKIISTLLQQLKDDVEITYSVERGAAQNTNSRDEIMKLLLRQKADAFDCMDEVIEEVVRNFSVELIELLLERQGDDIQATRQLMVAVRNNRRKRLEHMEEIEDLLLAKKFYGFEITQSLLVDIVRNFDAWAMAHLLWQETGGIEVTSKVLQAAAENVEGGDGVMYLPQ